MWGGARGPVGTRRRAELKLCGSAAARFQAIRGLGYRALRVGMICGISDVYSGDALVQRVINRAPAAVPRTDRGEHAPLPRVAISLVKLRWALGEVAGVGLSCFQKPAC
jgi:hypothetical protein